MRNYTLLFPALPCEVFDQCEGARRFAKYPVYLSKINEVHPSSLDRMCWQARNVTKTLDSSLCIQSSKNVGGFEQVEAKPPQWSTGGSSGDANAVPLHVLLSSVQGTAAGGEFRARCQTGASCASPPRVTLQRQVPLARVLFRTQHRPQHCSLSHRHTRPPASPGMHDRNE
jgi:hypothetical protein